MPTGSWGGEHRHPQTLTQTLSPGQLEAGGQVSPSALKAPGFSSAIRWDHQDVATTPGSGTPSMEAARQQLLHQCRVPAPCRGEPAPCTPPWRAGEEQDRQELPALQAGQPHQALWVLRTSHTPKDTCPQPSRGLAGTWLSSAGTGVWQWIPGHHTRPAMLWHSRAEFKGAVTAKRSLLLPGHSLRVVPIQHCLFFEQPIPGAHHGTATHRRPAGAPWPGAARRAT